MKYIITPEICISILAIIISTVALIRSNKVAQEQLKLERVTAELSKKQLELLQAEEASKAKPKLNVTIQQLGQNNCFYITNRGSVNIYNVNFELIDLQPRDHPLLDAHEKLPHKELRAESVLKLRAVFHIGSPSKYEVKLSWTDEQGNPFEELFYPTR